MIFIVHFLCIFSVFVSPEGSYVLFSVWLLFAACRDLFYHFVSGLTYHTCGFAAVATTAASVPQFNHFTAQIDFAGCIAAGAASS